MIRINVISEWLSHAAEIFLSVYCQYINADAYVVYLYIGTVKI